MNNSRNTNAVNYAILANCRLLIFQVPQVKVPHYFWETNRSVDALTGFGIQQASDVLYYNSSPPCLLDFFLFDLYGVYHVRLCPDFDVSAYFS